MLFKKKFARSYWFQGLLDAEAFTLHGEWKDSCLNYLTCQEYASGVHDYYSFRKELEEKLND